MTRKEENIWFLGILCSFWIISLIVAKDHLTHYDEPAYADPAINLINGRGFTTTAWYSQTSDKFFAANVPLYQLALAGWFKIAGTGHLQARALSLLMLTLGSWLLLKTIRRKGWIQKPHNRLIFFVLLLCGENTYILVNFGRPDSLTFFLACATLYSVTFFTLPFRVLFLIVLGIVSTFAGLQLPVAWATVAAVTILFFGRRHLADTLLYGAGCLVGLGFLLTLYWFTDSLGAFKAGISPHVAGSGWNPNKLRGFYGDRSFIFYSIAVLALYSSVAFLQRRAIIDAIATFPFPIGKSNPRRDLTEINSVLYLASLFICIPIGLLSAGKFPAPYTWMATLPGLIGLFYVRERFFTPTFCRISIFSLLIGGMLVGLPLRLGIRLAYWQDDNRQRLQEFAEKTISPEDTVLYATPVFFETKTRSHQAFYVERYIGLLNDEDINRLSLLLITQEQFTRLSGLLGEKWEPTGQSINVYHRRFPLKDTAIRIVAYRRSDR